MAIRTHQLGSICILFENGQLFGVTINGAAAGEDEILDVVVLHGLKWEEDGRSQNGAELGD